LIYINQSIRSEFFTTLKVREPTNDETMLKLRDALAGKLIVYRIDKKTNKKIDLTDKYGRLKDSCIPEKVSYYKFMSFYYKRKGIYTTHGFSNFFCNYNIIDAEKYLIDMYMGGTIFQRPKGYKFAHYINLKEYLEQKQKKEQFNDLKGSEYEKFVGVKFEQGGFKVVYNGIEQGVKDNSIDLIAQKNQTIYLVQCKNWKFENYKRMNHKDLKAFVGDCFIYKLRNYSKTDFNIKFVFVTSDEILSKSAQIFINQNRDILEHRVLRFE